MRRVRSVPPLQRCMSPLVSRTFLCEGGPSCVKEDLPFLLDVMRCGATADTSHHHRTHPHSSFWGEISSIIIYNEYCMGSVALVLLSPLSLS